MKNDKGSGAALWVLLIVLILVVAFVVPWTVSLVDETGDETGASETTKYAIMGAAVCLIVGAVVLIGTKLGS